MKRVLFSILTMLGLSVMPLVASAGETKCHVCSMKVDDAHNVHFKYVLESKSEIHLGSLTCAEKYWSENKNQKMVFHAKDFVTGKYAPAEKGFFLVGSKLSVGTGMDKGGAVFFATRDMAEKAKKANGGRILSLSEALGAVER